MVTADKPRQLVAYPLWPKQDQMFHLLDVERVNQLLYGGSAGPGKALDVETPIPTPSGWTTMGALKVGDEVFAEDGRVCRVTQTFDHHTPARAYRLIFDDGSHIDASGEHLWLTFDATELGNLTRRSPEWRARRREKRASRVAGNRSRAQTEHIVAWNKAHPPATLPAPSGTVRDTDTIVATLLTPRGRRNHAVPVSGPLELPEVDLPLDPYLLGVWLGDGNTDAGRITTMDAEIEAAFIAEGFDFGPKAPRGRAWSATAYGLATILRSVGVFGNKHIPLRYFRASAGQRLALLQGLMDTDGCVTDDGGGEFTTTNRALADGVSELIVSLGWKARLSEGRATLYGKDCGPKYRINFTPGDYVFRLSRKRDRQRLATRRTTRFRYIVDAQPIEPKTMRCVSVDSPSRLFLAGRQMIPTHNSYALRARAFHCSQMWPGARIAIFREAYTQLRKTQIIKWFAEMGKLGMEIKDHWRESSGEWTFENPHNPGLPTVVEFLHLDQSIGAEKWQSAEWAFLGIDEATQMEREDIELLYTRVRVDDGLKELWRQLADEREAQARKIGVDDPEMIARIRTDWHPQAVYATNPGGKSHDFFKSEFIDESRQHDGAWTTSQDINLDGEKVTVETRRFFLPGLLTDNPAIDPVEYASNLSMLSNTRRKEQLLAGDWDYFEGKVFDMLDPEVHYVSAKRPFGGKIAPPLDWPRIGGQDHGTTSPTAAIWLTRDEDGFFIAYLEYYAPGPVGEHIRAIRSLMALDGKNDLAFLGDPRMWIKTKGTDRQWSVADEYRYGGEPPEDPAMLAVAARKGITVIPSQVERIAGRISLQRMFEPDPERVFPDWHPKAGLHGAPRLFITTGCPNLWRELNSLRFQEQSEEIVKENDHAYDALYRAAVLFEQGVTGRRRGGPVRTIGYRRSA